MAGLSDQRSRLLREDNWDATGLSQELYSMFAPGAPEVTSAPISINKGSPDMPALVMNGFSSGDSIITINRGADTFGDVNFTGTPPGGVTIGGVTIGGFSYNAPAEAGPPAAVNLPPITDTNGTINYQNGGDTYTTNNVYNTGGGVDNTRPVDSTTPADLDFPPLENNQPTVDGTRLTNDPVTGDPAPTTGGNPGGPDGPTVGPRGDPLPPTKPKISAEISQAGLMFAADLLRAFSQLGIVRGENPAEFDMGRLRDILGVSGGSTGGGGVPGKVLSGTGSTYQVQLYPNGPSAAAGATVSVKQLQIDSGATIPVNTWAIVTLAGAQYCMQVPVWLAPET